MPRPLQAQAPPGEGETRQVLLLSNPIHTDLALPLDEELMQHFSFLTQTTLPIGDIRARFAIFGWGGREFYLRTPTWAEFQLSTAARSFTLDRSVMHVAVTGAIDTSHPAVTVFDIPAADYAAMLEAIAATFEKDAQKGLPIPVGKGYGASDAFFEAKGRFNAFMGCNTWTAAMLRAGGMQTGFWTPLPPLLRWSLHLHNPASAGRGTSMRT